MAEAVLGKSNVVRVLGCDLKYWAYVCKERPVSVLRTGSAFHTDIPVLRIRTEGLY